MLNEYRTLPHDSQPYRKDDAMRYTCDCFPALQTSVRCCHCQKLISWPRWVRTEHLHYDSLCWPCFDQIDRNFTTEHAICQALIIVGVHQGALGVQR
jgi:hypothetical protein